MTSVKFKVHAHVEPTHLELDHALKSSISGTLFIQVGDVYFPANGWGDYVIPVLYWWLDNAMRLYVPDSEIKNICMDGPQTFSTCRGAGSDEVRLTLRENDRTIAGQYTISYRRCLAAFRGAAKSVLNELRDLGATEQGEMSILRSSLEQVERLELRVKEHGLP